MATQKKIIQNNIPTRRIIQHVYLRADSERAAFYLLFLEEEKGRYFVRKISGGADAIGDERQWEETSIDLAYKRFAKIIRDKTRDNRKSPRKYRVEYATTLKQLLPDTAILNH